MRIIRKKFTFLPVHVSNTLFNTQIHFDVLTHLGATNLIFWVNLTKFFFWLEGNINPYKKVDSLLVWGAITAKIQLSFLS